jgi:hypothetical protein
MAAHLPIPAPFRPRSTFTLAVSLVGCAGLPAIFLPFTFGASPFAALLSTYFPLAVPLVLSLAIAAVSAAWVAAGSLGPRARLAARVAGLAGAAGFAWLYVRPRLGGMFELNMRESPAVVWVPPLVLLAAGLLLSAWLARQPRARDAAAIVLLEGVYVAGATQCLVGFWDDYDAGAYFVAVATAAYLAQMIGVTVAVYRTRRAA